MCLCLPWIYRECWNIVFPISWLNSVRQSQEMPRKNQESIPVIQMQ